MNARLTRLGFVPLLLLTTLLVLAMSLVASTPSADAGSSFSYRATGKSASTYWTQIDGIPTGSSPVGNVHVGWLNADETTRGKAAVFGYIEDWDCEEGETPGWGGPGPHGGEIIIIDEPPPVETECDWMGNRFIESYDVPFTFDRKLATATLKGRLTVYGGGHGEGGVVGRPAADILWTGVGTVSSSRYTSRWREGGTWYSDTYSSTSRNATMSGILGPMGFDPDLSGGYLYTFKNSGRSRTR